MSPDPSSCPCTNVTQTEADAARVEAYILATKSHACKEDEEGEEDLRLFLDIDMSVLGQPCDGGWMLRFRAWVVGCHRRRCRPWTRTDAD